MLGAEEIERRAPVWRALSDLFLDTELDEADIAIIAETIRAAGFSADQAEEILRRDVAPVFWMNLIQVAGEWTPWSESQVRDLVCEHLRSRSRPRYLAWFDILKSRRRMATVKPEWRQVRAYLEGVRT